MASQNPFNIDSTIWKACADPILFIPQVNASIVYFPEGHWEHSCSHDLNDALVSNRCLSSYFLCKINAVEVLADVHTDELYAKVTLIASTEGDQEHPSEDIQEEGMRLKGRCFKKLLSTDITTELKLPVHQGNVFPDEKTSQKVVIRDLHNKGWVFTHNYYASDDRYTLSEGWSKFVEDKDLHSGDKVVFVKDVSDTIFAAIQRCIPIAAVEAEKQTTNKNCEIGTNGANVWEALTRIQNGEPFQVQFYPGFGDFLVDPSYFCETENVDWEEGMRVRLVKQDGPFKRGTITEVKESKSMWRMLQVIADDADSELPYAVSPWEVKVISNEDV